MNQTGQERYWHTDKGRCFVARFLPSIDGWMLSEIIKTQAGDTFRKPKEKQAGRFMGPGACEIYLTSTLGLVLTSAPCPQPLQPEIPEIITLTVPDLIPENASALWSLILSEAWKEPHEGSNMAVGAQLRAAEKIGLAMVPPVAGQDIINFLAKIRGKKVAAGKAKVKRTKVNEPSSLTNTLIERVNLSENPDVVRAFAEKRLSDDLRAVLSGAPMGAIYKIKSSEKVMIQKMLKDIPGEYSVLAKDGMVYIERIG